MRWTFPLGVYAAAWFAYLKYPEAHWWIFVGMAAAAVITWWWMFVRFNTFLALIIYSTGAFLFAQILMQFHLIYAAVIVVIFGVLVSVLKNLEFEWQRAITGHLYPMDSAQEDVARTPYYDFIHSWYAITIILFAHYLWITAALGLLYVGGIQQSSGLMLIFAGSFIFNLWLYDLAHMPLVRKYITTLMFAAVMGFAVVQIAFVIQFTPLTYFGQGAVVLISSYILSDIVILSQQKRLTRPIFLRNLAMGIALVIFVFLVTLRIIPSMMP